jgi:hypothetical protein
MKRLITTMIFVVIMSSALGTYVIPRTITVDALTLPPINMNLAWNIWKETRIELLDLSCYYAYW